MITKAHVLKEQSHNYYIFKIFIEFFTFKKWSTFWLSIVILKCLKPNLFDIFLWKLTSQLFLRP